MLPTVFAHVNVVPMDRNVVLADQTVIVRGKTIDWVGPSKSAQPPAHARIVDGRGKYLMPGLVDMHCHLYAPQELTMFLANGVTSVYNLNGYPAHLKWRDRVNAGKLDGPTIYSCAPAFFECETAQEAREKVDLYAKQGYDSIKIYNNVKKAAFGTLISEAQIHQMGVVGHIPREVGLEGVLAAKMPIAHAEEYIYTFFQNDVTKTNLIPRAAQMTLQAGDPVIATLVCYKHIIQQGKDINRFLKKPEIAYLSPWSLATWQPNSNTYALRFSKPSGYQFLEKGLALQEELLGQIRRGGGTVLVGTDSMVTGVVPGFCVLEEIQNLNDIGFSPYEAFKAATSDPAKVLNRGSVFGTIGKGKRADLVLLDANPLLRVENFKKRAGVMAQGKWFPSTVLDKRLAVIPDSYRTVLSRAAKSLRTDPIRAWNYLSENDPFGDLSRYLVEGFAKREGFSAYETMFRKLKRKAPNAEILSESWVNEFGYRLVKLDHLPKLAIQVFSLNVREHPKSGNCLDSLAEGYLLSGDKANALKFYRRAFEVDPKVPGIEGRIKALER